MKEITFTGSVSEVHRAANEWKASNPHVKIVNTGAPIRVGYQDGQDVFQKTDWTLTVRYEDTSSN